MRRVLLLVSAALVATAAAACRDQPPSGPQSSGAREAGLGSASAGAALAAAPEAAPGSRPFLAEKVTGEGHAMGTHLAYAAYTTEHLDPAAIRASFEAATAEIVRLERLMTTWTPDSEIARVNAAAGRSAVAVSPETFDVVREALHASDLSGGAFDITFETLHGLWKFDQDLDPHPPSAADVAARLKYVGFRHVRLDQAAQTIFLDEPHVKIGLGGIAKGYAVDKASKVLSDAGVSAFYVQAGGDLFAHGTKPDGSPWLAGVRDPRGPDGDYFAMMPVSDHAFSTAGDYERTYVVGGRRYHHIIDPHTGYPATASRSVTIWAPTALLADELDDGVFILGPKRGLELVESLEGVGAVIVDSGGQVWVSKRLEGRIHQVHPPRDVP